MNDDEERLLVIETTVRNALDLLYTLPCVRERFQIAPQVRYPKTPNEISGPAAASHREKAIIIDPFDWLWTPSDRPDLPEAGEPQIHATWQHFIAAHELRHLYDENHEIARRNRKEAELDADGFAGRLYGDLTKLLSDSLSSSPPPPPFKIVDLLLDLDEDETHPAGNLRAAAFQRAFEESTGLSLC